MDMSYIAITKASLETMHVENSSKIYKVCGCTMMKLQGVNAYNLWCIFLSMP